jgi:hypothetical protein
MPIESQPAPAPAREASAPGAPVARADAPPSEPDVAAAVEAVPYKTWLIAAVLLAVLLQIILVVGSPAIAKDGITFIEMAKGLTRSPVETMRAADQHPGFPAMVVVGRWLVLPFVPSDSIFSWIWGARLVSGVFGILVIIPAWLLANRTFDRRAAIVAAFVVALLPLFRRNAADALSDSPHLFFYLLAVWLAVEGAARRQWKWFLGVGAASGLAFWIRPEGLSPVVVMACLLPFWAWRTRKLRARSVVLFVLVMALGAAAVMAPYRILAGKFTSKITNKEYLLPQAGAGGGEARFETNALQPARPPLGPGGRMELVANVDKSVPRSVPGTKAAPAEPERIPRPWWVAVDALVETVMEVAHSLRWVLVVPLFAGVFFRDRRRDRDASHAIVIGMVAFHALLLIGLYYAGGYLSDRHVMPIVLLAVPRVSAGMLLLAGWVSRAILRADDTNLDRRRGWVVAAFLAAFAVLAAPWTLAPLHPEEIPVIETSLGLKVHAKPGDQVLSNSVYVPFYSQIPGRTIAKRDASALNLSKAAQRYRFVVLDGQADPFRTVWLDQLSERYEELHLIGARERGIHAFILRPALPAAP